MEAKEQLMTPDEVAERLSISAQTVRGYIRTGRIRAIKVGRLWRVRDSDLQEYMRGDRI